MSENVLYIGASMTLFKKNYLGDQLLIILLRIFTV